MSAAELTAKIAQLKSATAKIAQLKSAEDANSSAVVEYARTLAPVLRDAGRENSAKELERFLFMYDAQKQETQAFFRENVRAFLDLLIRKPGGPPA